MHGSQRRMARRKASVCAGTSSTASPRRRTQAGVPAKQRLQPRRQFRGCQPVRGEPASGCALEHQRRPCCARQCTGTNLKVVTGALIDRLFHGGQARPAVSNSCREGVRHTVRARIETVLTAGAIGSPDNPAALRDRPRRRTAAESRRRRYSHDLPGVGGNLQDHLQLRMIFKVAGHQDAEPASANSLWGKAMMGLEYALFRTGPLSMAPSQLGAVYALARGRSDAGSSSSTCSHCHSTSSVIRCIDFPAFTASVCNLRPSLARRACSSAMPNRRRSPLDCAELPVARGNDRLVAARALRLTRQHRRLSRRWRPTGRRSTCPASAARVSRRDEALAQAAGDIGTTIFHPVGTCAMGT
jgi:choline dehydrogenase